MRASNGATAGRLPDFVVIGAMKSGTTTLFRYLQSHPSLFMPELKEPDFFVYQKGWRKGFDWYSSLFAEAPAGALVGEGSTNYTKAASFPESASLLREHVPHAKLIYLLRDPVERIRSQYVHAFLSGQERGSFEEAIRVDSGYLDTSLYGKQLARYLEYFPREQVKVILTEDMRDCPADLLASVEQFLGVDSYAFDDLDRHDHVSADRRANSRIATLLKRNDRLLDWSRRSLPAGFRKRIKHGLTRTVETREFRLPAAVLSRLREPLAQDRELLMTQCDLDLGRWTPLEAIG